jgi:hypothetical protein
MKTATLPSIRVEPEFRDQVESMLAEGETLSAFVESALRESLHRRRAQAEFLKRGMDSLARVKAGEPTISAEEMITELRARTAAARALQAQTKAGKKSAP